MVKNLVIHLGDRKAGSTSIQNALVSKTWHADNTTLFYSARFKQTRFVDKPKYQLDKLAKQINRSDADFGVISSEHFEGEDPVEVKEMIARHFPDHLETVRLISYIRPHAQRILSSFSERTKVGRISESLVDFHRLLEDRRVLFYEGRCKKWREVFGNAYTVRPMVRENLINNCIVHDFFHFLFEGRNFGLTEIPVLNTSPSFEDLALLRAIHERLAIFDLSLEELRLFGKSFDWAVLSEISPPGLTKLAIHQSLMADIKKTYSNDAERMDNEFFEGNPMQMAMKKAEENAIAEEQFKLTDNLFTPGELRLIEILAEAIGRMHTADPRKWANLFRSLRRQSMNGDASVKDMPT